MAVGDLERLTGLAPQVTTGCRVLILGSLPGAMSLAQAQYYVHPRNQFWGIIGQLLGTDLAVMPYAQRIAALNARGIGLWDCIASAQRRGSLDGAIREAEVNPLAGFVAGLSALEVIAFNGGTAARIGREQIADLPHIRALAMPSTSPAYTRPLAEKLAAWQALAPFVAPPWPLHSP